MLCGINVRFQTVSHSERQVPHVLLTRPPLASTPKGLRSFDLHVLGAPPAFVLSQDQTLWTCYIYSHFSVTEHIKVCFSLSFLKSRWLYFTFGIYSNEYKGLILLVLLECCSIFKVLSAAAFVDSFVIISNSFALVNRFFKIYFTFLRSTLKCVSHRQKARIAYRKVQMPK